MNHTMFYATAGDLANDNPYKDEKALHAMQGLLHDAGLSPNDAKVVAIYIADLKQTATANLRLRNAPMKTHYAISFKRSEIRSMKAIDRAKRKLNRALKRMSNRERRALFQWLDGDTNNIHEFIEMIARLMPNSYDDNVRDDAAVAARMKDV
jgi:hypothetical protein